MIFLVDVDGIPQLRLAGASVIDPDTKSGNPAHEAGTGRFGSTGKKKQLPRRALPKSQQKDMAGSEQRRRDAVMDAARTLTDLSPDGVREFVTARWRGARVLTEADIQSFSADAQRQRLDDVVDALDARLRSKVYGRSENRVVKTEFPRRLLNVSLRGFDDAQIQEILKRLSFRRWTPEQIKRYVVKTYSLDQASS